MDRTSVATSLYLREVSLRREAVPDFGRYPFNLPAIASLDRLAFDERVTFLIGENGSGKSTLLEAIAVALGYNPEGGSRHFRFGTRPSHSELHEYLRVVRNVVRPRDGYFLRAESYFNVATEIERLDEPPGDPRSPLRQMALLSRLHILVQAPSQFIVATHSPILLAYPGAAIYQLDSNEMHRVQYEDTEHFRVTRDFLNRYPPMLKELLGGDDAP